MVTEMDGQLEGRVLILTPTRKDGEVTRTLLTEAGLGCVVCEGLECLGREVEAGAGAVLITEEAITAEGIEGLLEILKKQPTWSDLAFVVLMRGGGQSVAAARVLHALGNVTLLERPAPMRSVVSAVQAAVRGRRRQYQLREQMAHLKELHQRLEGLLESERAARTQAERANYLKDEFLATISHELRTPLNAILGWAEVIRRTNKDPKEVANGMEVIERNARLQAQLIEDLLDMSRIISGKIRMDVREMEPLAAIDAAVESVLPAAEAKGIRVQTILDPVGPILADAGRLQQVIWNLLSNAVKFTPRGGRVAVMLQRVHSHVEIGVMDTGQGIKAEFVPHVFERFRQADASTTRTHGGLGLGLAIVKQLVELHGGSVHARSPGEGQGSTFTVQLPLMAVRGARDEAADPPARQVVTNGAWELTDLAGVKVLVVDDDADARQLLRRLLAECKAEVATAGSGVEALDYLSRVRPDVLISDIGMPQMDGYQLIEKVRLLYGANGGGIPAAALTAFARSEDRQRALGAGFQSHVAKPVEPAELVAVVASLAGRAGA